jgi:hypothetical protein
MAAQAVLDKTALSLKIVYQPFLSSTRTRQLTSLLAPLPHTFLPIADTSLNIPSQAEIVLVSRGGKPFASIYQRPSPDSHIYRSKQERDWNTSSQKYKQILSQWDDIQRRLPPLIESLRQHFSDRVIQNQAFHAPLKILEYTNQIPDPDALRKTIKSFRSLRNTQLSIYPILRKTQAPFKLAARQQFGFSNLRTREYAIEHQRDLLDLFRFELEKRYRGMALVRYPDISEPKPWILVPDDPVGAWGHEFAYRVNSLIDLARERFLMTTEEKDELLDLQAREIIEENEPALLRKGSIDEGLLWHVKNTLQEQKRKLYHDDTSALSMSGNVGDLESYKVPVSREDKAVYEHSDKELVKRGAWRVED